MISQNNSISNENGSALIVTMLLTSVLLMTALILLQRIVPYANSVRSMHEASLAYYLARGQTDLARYNFLYGNGGGMSFQIPSPFGLLSQQYINTTISGTRIDDIENIETEIVNGIMVRKLEIPFAGTMILGEEKAEYSIVSSLNNIPVRTRLYPTDLDGSIKNFGTSKSSNQYHTLSALNAGGLRFDIVGVDTATAGVNSFDLQIKTNPPSSGKIILKIQRYNGSITTTFTAEYTLNPLTGITQLSGGSGNSILGNIQSIDAIGTISTSTSTLQNFLNLNNCSAVNVEVCSLVLIPSPGTPSIDFQLISSVPIPDLNAIVIGDGLSGNGLYHQRVLDLIPTPQDI